MGNGNLKALKVSGNIELTEVDIAFKTAGRLVTLAVEEGDRVKKGALIARLDQEELLQRRESAAASLDSTRSAYCSQARQLSINASRRKHNSVAVELNSTRRKRLKRT